MAGDGGETPSLANQRLADAGELAVDRRLGGDRLRVAVWRGESARQQFGARLENRHPRFQPDIASRMSLGTGLVRNCSTDESGGPLWFQFAAQNFHRWHAVDLPVADGTVQGTRLAFGEFGRNMTRGRAA